MKKPKEKVMTDGNALRLLNSCRDRLVSMQIKIPQEALEQYADDPNFIHYLKQTPLRFFRGAFYDLSHERIEDWLFKGEDPDGCNIRRVERNLRRLKRKGLFSRRAEVSDALSKLENKAIDHLDAFRRVALHYSRELAKNYFTLSDFNTGQSWEKANQCLDYICLKQLKEPISIEHTTDLPAGIKDSISIIQKTWTNGQDRGHHFIMRNASLFVINGDLAIKIFWGDFNEKDISEVPGPVYALTESRGYWDIPEYARPVLRVDARNNDPFSVSKRRESLPLETLALGAGYVDCFAHGKIINGQFVQSWQS